MARFPSIKTRNFAFTLRKSSNILDLHDKIYNILLANHEFLNEQLNLSWLVDHRGRSVIRFSNLAEGLNFRAGRYN